MYIKIKANEEIRISNKKVTPLKKLKLTIFENLKNQKAVTSGTLNQRGQLLPHFHHHDTALYSLLHHSAATIHFNKVHTRIKHIFVDFFNQSSGKFNKNYKCSYTVLQRNMCWCLKNVLIIIVYLCFLY